ncbi:transcriptional regulator, TraR/DksA family [Roseivivax lentus]|uniref:Transcriptional regulator, TraR/DksA family n=1 Tax=Roseivivax lentus TaxID=633194 RepID=A0A1N7L4H3_9RHOB|nr:TraR/DksA family transcriptional regulator [Roseivivax lentus]SIS68681.1 transcriptional regulator, TraR/DksA family [Roseivivax lentus]
MGATREKRWTSLIEARLAALDEEDRLGRDGQSVVALDQQSVGRLSRMDALQSQAMAKATQGRRDRMRRALQLALGRIAEGEFGYCEECGDEIAVARLELDPTARRCVDCAG